MIIVNFIIIIIIIIILRTFLIWYNNRYQTRPVSTSQMVLGYLCLIGLPIRPIRDLRTLAGSLVDNYTIELATKYSYFIYLFS